MDGAQKVAAQCRVAVALITLLPTFAAAQTAAELREGAAYAAAFCIEDFPLLDASKTESLAMLAGSDAVELASPADPGSGKYQMKRKRGGEEFRYEMELEEAVSKTSDAYRFSCAVTTHDVAFDETAADELIEEYETSYEDRLADGSFKLAMRKIGDADDLVAYERSEKDVRGCTLFHSLLVIPSKGASRFVVGGMKRDEVCGGPSILQPIVDAQ